MDRLQQFEMCFGGVGLRVARGASGIRAIEFLPGAPDGVEPADPLLREASRQLAAYFEGRLRAFDLPLELAGTSFQLRVWEALRAIPYGAVRSYAQVAAAIGEPAAVRAVGAANGRNPIAIVVPCHRVIGASGKLVGYGGGLETKKRLLEWEARNCGNASETFLFTSVPIT